MPTLAFDADCVIDKIYRDGNWCALSPRRV
jgi:hypothetical protein